MTISITRHIKARDIIPVLLHWEKYPSWCEEEVLSLEKIVSEDPVDECLEIHIPSLSPSRMRCQMRFFKADSREPRKANCTSTTVRVTIITWGRISIESSVYPESHLYRPILAQKGNQRPRTSN